MSTSSALESPALIPTAASVPNLPQDLPDSYSFRIKRVLNNLLSLEAKEKKLGWDSTQVTKLRQKWIFGQTLQSLYRDIDISKEKLNVLILAVVDTDGVGDYFHELHSGHQIQKIFPNATVTLGAEVIKLRSGKRENQLPISQFQTFLWGCHGGKGTVTSGGRLEDAALDGAIKEKCLEAAKTASVILDISHQTYPNSLLMGSNHGKKTGAKGFSRFGKAVPYTRILEYDSNGGRFGISIESRNYAKRPRPFWSNKNSMGVNEFELGLLWRSPNGDEAKLTAVKDLMLQSILLPPSSSSQGSDSEKNYFQTHGLHFAYLHKERNIDNFIKSCLLMHKTDQASFVDIIISDKFDEEQNLISQLDSEGYLSGIKQVYIYKKKPNSNSQGWKGQTWSTSFWEPTQQPESAHKTLRLINPFPLLPEDMQILRRVSTVPIGCTGDNSVIETFSDNQIPFYESPGNKGFDWSLISLAREYFQSDNLCIQYLELVSNLYYKGLSIENAAFLKNGLEQMPQLLLDKQLALEMNRFIQFLKKHYNFNEVLVDIVSREVLRKQFPELKAKEKELFSAYYNQTKSLDLCYQEYKQFIASLKQNRSFTLLPISEISPELKAIPNKITIAVRFDLGWDPLHKELWLRGSGAPGLNWKEGIALKKVEQGLWRWEASNLAFSKLEFKVLIGDEEWEKGPNHEIQAKTGETYVEITPYF